ncbi:MAG: sarcosine oxidase subunit delta [Alphaproteobacteria bacterium]|nr:sarcosine oxidase subunit delta [Alphaproteobacteria bacterium]
MHLIPCPWCGERHESEFVYFGEKKSSRPLDVSGLSDAEWLEFLTRRENPVGPVREKWWHLRGCGSMFSIERDTRTHDFSPGSAEMPK